MKKVSIAIEGMTCGHCVMAVNKELTDKGIIVEKVEIGSAIVTYDEAIVADSTLTEAVTEAGFTVVSIENLS